MCEAMPPHLSEEHVGRGQVGRHGGAALPQRAADGGVEQRGQLGVVVLEHDGGGELFGVLTQEKARGHGCRADHHRAQALQKRQLVQEEAFGSGNSRRGKSKRPKRPEQEIEAKTFIPAEGSP